jgi:hypothetical protein
VAYKACDSHVYVHPDCAGCQVTMAYVKSQREADDAQRRRVEKLREALAAGRDYKHLLREVRRFDLTRSCPKHHAQTPDCGTCAQASLVADADKQYERRRRELNDIVTQFERDQEARQRTDRSPDTGAGRRTAAAVGVSGAVGGGGLGPVIGGGLVIAAVVGAVWLVLFVVGWILSHLLVLGLAVVVITLLVLGLRRLRTRRATP